MSQHSAHASRPTIPSREELAALPPDGGPNWNRLVFEQSPYLLQHAANPVDWHPWGDAAFERARREDKPVFLSVGYSTCHWCHVMEHESFEDKDVARLMNEAFVCIKVDREERPDIDQVYMTVTQALTGQGGWPMTVVMTADRKPFFAGTYFPKGGGYSRPGMMELVPALAKAWRENRDDIMESADQITAQIGGLKKGAPGGVLSEDVFRSALAEFASDFDTVHGGFAGGRHKFPVPHQLSFLLRVHDRLRDPAALAMVEKTLQCMRMGGIFDHVGFGFHRYSTDQQWLLPHFEKMLYDQAMMAIAYLDAHQVTGNEEYARTAREIFRYVLRDMTSPEGGFTCAEDADSEGVEGKFYVWTPEEVAAVLGREDAELFCRVFNIEKGGNFFEEATGRKTGESIPHLRAPLGETAAKLGVAESLLRARLEGARAKLFAAREKRVHPYKDDKILTDWNGLMIAAFARGARVLDDPEYATAARRAADFALGSLRAPDGRLFKRYRSGEAGLPAHLEDYAFLVWGLLELYEATFEVRYLEEAVSLNRQMLDRFWDAEGGGLFLTANDGEELIVRPKDAYDGAIPSGNSVAACNLLRIAAITGDSGLESRATQIISAFSAGIGRAPQGHTQMLIAFDRLVGPQSEIVIAGDSESSATLALARVARRAFAPRAVLLHRPDGEDAPIARLAPFTAVQTAPAGESRAYVCRNQTCELPVATAEELEARLRR